MAGDKLQKTLQAPSGITSVGNPVGPDTSTADAINAATKVGLAAAGIVSDVKLSNRKEELTENLQGLGEEVSAIQGGDQLGRTSERIQRLKRLRDQGRLSDDVINIEVEAELKRAIDTSPVFGDQLRREAAQQLGFDPTGSYTQSLFNNASKAGKARPLTPAQKREQKAQVLVEFAGLSLDNAIGVIGQTEANELLVKASVARASIGQSGQEDIVDAGLGRVDEFVLDAMGAVLAQVKEGGLKSPEALGSALSVKKQELLFSMSNAAKEAGIKFDTIKANAQIDAKFKGIEAMVSDGTMEGILDRQANSLTASAKIVGYEAMGHYAAMNAAGGQALVAAGIEAAANMQNPDQLKLMSQIDPNLKLFLGNQSKVMNTWKASYSDIMGVPQEEGATFVSPQMNDAVIQVTVKGEKDQEIRDRMLVNGLAKRGQSFKDYSQYAQSGVRALVTPDEVKYVQTNWKKDKPALLARIGASVEAKGGVELYIDDKGKVSARGMLNERRIKAGQSPRLGITIPSVLQLDIDRLNAMNGMVSNGWAEDLGEAKGVFLQRTINEINTLRADKAPTQERANAIKAYRESPSVESLAAIRAVDPELADRVEEYRASAGVPTDGK